DYNEAARQFSIEYLQSIDGEGRLKEVSPDFVARALTFMPRAVYMRPGVALDTIKQLDATFQSRSTNFLNRMSRL
ncbi:MAG TPA: hypothetical protein VM531_11000, partial [Sphingomicrobium sp.]|nr:hypothetical protein [Sphingomicrobium sp.]